jgi:hypothetical protein
LLPGYECATSYLEQINQNHWYSDFSPLVQKLESRLANMFGTGPNSAVTTSNDTSGLTNILRVLDLLRGTLCLLPAWTFIATPACVRGCCRTYSVFHRSQRRNLVAPLRRDGSVIFMALASHPYASSAYANAFAPPYTPIMLQETQTFVLKRAIAAKEYSDAIGGYPLRPIAENANQEKDFAALREEGIVSLVLVTDPFFHPPPAALEQHFDKVTAYKEHYLNDFSHPQLYDSKNHHYKVRRSLRSCEVKTISLKEYLVEWCEDFASSSSSLVAFLAMPLPQ